MPDQSLPYIEVRQKNREFILTALPIWLLTKIAYASVRGKDEEEGAVQRVLNSRRISSIKDYTLEVGDYPASVVLNWINENKPLAKKNGQIIIPDVAHAAQLIDGQHRVAGLRAAMEEKSSIRNMQIPVAIFENLSTQDCASLFLSINTEQKPVPKSLVIDLYGVADPSVVDPAAARARDLVLDLNEDEEAPYYEQIKLPGSPRRRGGIALSTAASAIKPLVEEKGDFEQRGITELEMQKKVIKNFFGALADRYGDAWDDPGNAFLYASGFIGAIDFFKAKLLSYGHTHKNFTRKFFFEAIQISQDDLILQQEVKGKGGKDAPTMITERLNSFFAPKKGKESRFEI